MANAKRHKRREQEEFLKNQQEEMDIAKQLISPEYPHANNVNSSRTGQDETSLPCADVSGEGLESPMEVEQRPLQINFGDDSDLESPNRYTHSVAACVSCKPAHVSGPMYCTTTF